MFEQKDDFVVVVVHHGEGLFDLTRGRRQERERHGALVSLWLVVFIILVDIIIRLDFDCLPKSDGSSSCSRRHVSLIFNSPNKNCGFYSNNFLRHW
ncbi:hypothetical protein OUZ56_030963 [Daphnia magna]|uniref:Transmembrane protein n=1 Tax=Daphnia magna TaxID=35525 RepID=A0ABQ9ZU30_9CRUS|nr:hypothetical protein OUZ56_030963 [Daphnia magna]